MSEQKRRPGINTWGRCVITRERLYATLKTALHFVSLDEPSRGMCGVELRIGQGRLEVWAANLQSLIRLHPRVLEADGVSRLFFASALIKELAKDVKPLKAQRTDLLAVTIQDNFRVEGVTTIVDDTVHQFILEPSRARVPNYEKAICFPDPEEGLVSSICINGRLLQMAAKAHKIFIGDDLGPHFLVPNYDTSPIIFKSETAPSGSMLGVVMPVCV